jgi:MFS family permease
MALVIICGIAKWFPAGVCATAGSDPVSRIQPSDIDNAASLLDGPLLPEGTRGQLVLICGILFFWGYAAYGVMAHFAAYAISVEVRSSQAAFALAFMGAMISFGKIAIGIGVDRFGSKPTLVAALAMMFTSLLWLKQASSLWEFYLFAVIFSFGFACASVVMPGLVADTFGLRSHGYLLGITNVFACAGCATGPVLAGHLYDASGNYNSAIWIFAVSGLASAALASCLRYSPTGLKRQAK